MSSVRSAVASALAAPVLVLLVSAGPVAAQGEAAQADTAQAGSAQAGSAVDGTYYVRDALTGRCLAGAQVATCGTDGTAWSLRNHADGTVQFQESGSGRRCLALPVALTYPAAVRLNTCDAALAADPSPDAGGRDAKADRWRIEGWVDGPVTIAHAYPPAGRLAVENSAVRVSNNSSVMWVLDPVRK
ncbi:hypothetical protein [Streptomyces sp. NBC_01497]|uniref:hypothetical protein n=1 Tax=Streptomyces sp. NBC_01497 TaxID=2903885 RepID=UPI002E2F5B15|nr:hypothetical protein [Streptomyces sp. NBC_01497]